MGPGATRSRRDPAEGPVNPVSPDEILSPRKIEIAGAYAQGDTCRTDDPLRYATATLGGARSFGAIPMMSGEALVGAFTICRQTVRPFGALATALAQTFADQSVIALENARTIVALRQKATPA